MNTTQNHHVDYSWAEIPPMRRHLYFYLMLVLGLTLAESLLGPHTPQRSPETAPAPPRLTSQEVYPAAVPALSPSPSDSEQ